MSNFSIIIPIYNEEAILQAQVEKILKTIKQSGIRGKFEMILVENGSIDNTRSTASALTKKHRQIKLVTLPYPSYGRAFKEGIRHTKYNFLFQFDIDFWDVAFLKKSLSLLEKKDIVIGSKNLATSHDHRSFTRKLISRSIELIIQKSFHLPLTDTHGIKAFRKEKIQPFIDNTKSNNHFFDTELLIRCYYANLTITELPVDLSELRKTRFSFITRSIDVIRELLHLLLIKDLPIQAKQPLHLHADDFGLRVETDVQILQLVKSKKIEEVSILANMISNSSLKSIQRIPVSRFLHLNFIEGQPVSGRGKVPTLIRRNGKFYSLPLLVCKLLLQSISTSDIRHEISAQLNKLTAENISIQGIDSHQHIHALSPFAEIVAEVAKSHNIKNIRAYNAIVPQTKKAKIKYSFLKLSAYLSYFLSYRKIGLPITWKLNSSKPLAIMSWESAGLDISKNPLITCVIHPFLGYDTNISYEAFFSKNT